MSSPGNLNPRAERLETLLLAIAEVANSLLGERPAVVRPVDPAGLPDMHGRTVPREVQDLYTVTGGGGAFGYTILRPHRLPVRNEEITEILEEYDLMGEDLPWGPPPVGDSLVTLADGRIPVFVAEVDDQPSGVTALDAGGDEGYHWMAPSLEALFEAWLGLTEAGVGVLYHDTEGVAQLGLRDSTERTVSRAERICQDHGCSLAAVGVWEI